MLSIGSLFSGIGGLERGLELGGLGPTRWQVEINPYRRWVLERHWPFAGRQSDIRELRVDDLVPVDLVCLGFPCENITSAGKKEGIDGAKSGLWKYAVRVLRALRPQYVVVENSAHLAARGLTRVLGDLAALGYDAEWSVISACAVGAPHARERLFVVAYADCYGEPVGPLHAEARWLRPDAVGLWNGRETEPGVVRMADGVPGGLDRIKALGSAVVPAVGAVVGRMIVRREERFMALALAGRL